jgi:small conductance mechanosensitive channel
MYEDPDWHRRLMEAPTVLRVNSFDDSGVSIKVIGTVRAADQWAAAGEFRRRILAAFGEHGIEIPFPHRVVISRAADAPALAEAIETVDEESSASDA